MRTWPGAGSVLIGPLSRKALSVVPVDAGRIHGHGSLGSAHAKARRLRRDSGLCESQKETYSFSAPSASASVASVSTSASAAGASSAVSVSVSALAGAGAAVFLLARLVAA